MTDAPRIRRAQEQLREILDDQVEQNPEALQLRERLLSVHALLANGNVITERYNFDAKNSTGPLPLKQRIDKYEYAAGYLPRRHEWLHGLETESKTTIFTALIKRMHVLETAERRDPELEQATVEMGSNYLMQPDEHGNYFLEGYYVRTGAAYYKDSRSRVSRVEHVTGFPISHGSFVSGSNIELVDDNADKWFVQSSSGHLTPLDAITEFDSAWIEGGAHRPTEYLRPPQSVS